MLISNKTKFGIAVPQMFADGDIDMALVANHLKLVENLGYDSVWTQDSVLGTMPTLDPFTLLAYASSLTRRVKLGISVLVMPLQNPVHLAKISASLDQLSQGRLLFGIGIGGAYQPYSAFGYSAEHRVTRFEDSLRLVKALWTKPQVTFKNQFWRLDNISINPKPIQTPHPPIWFGGQAEPALERAVRMGEAWMGAGASTTKQFKTAMASIGNYLKRYGKDRSNFPLGKRVYIAIDKDKETAAKKLEAWFGEYYHDVELARKVSVFGTNEEVINGLGEIINEAPDIIMLNPVYDLLEHAEKLAHDIIPKL